MMASKRILVIAGSDSSGGAGLEADQKVIAAHGCYAMTATTALTAQNTLGVYDIHAVPVAFLNKQLDACFDDIGVDVVKIGMLASADAIRLVVETLRERSVAKAVVDPVMVATTGASLLPPDALDDLRSLAGLAYILTPNIPELKQLVGCPSEEMHSLADLERLARLARSKLGSAWVLAKGGHLPLRTDYTAATTLEDKAIVVNVLVGPDGELHRIESTYQESRNTHGTGCSLASAIASNLANGMDACRAVTAACRYIDAAIEYAPGLGHGHGPLNHFHATSSLPFPRGGFVRYVLEHPDVAPLWQRYVGHAFVQALGRGSLPMASFKGYLVQDYLYLVHFARANALSAYKCKNMKDISRAAESIQQLEKEMELHVKFCAGYGITRKDMESAQEETACTAYSRHILDVGQSDNWFALQVALTPCIIGYGIAARAIYEEHKATQSDTHPYWTWVENYTTEEYRVLAKQTTDVIEDHARKQSPSRTEELVAIFKRSVQLEIAFWEMYPSE